jgi:hypothetical protein
MVAPATRAMSAVTVQPASGAYAYFDRLPNGFPRTRSGHSASVAAPDPSCPHTVKYVENRSFSKIRTEPGFRGIIIGVELVREPAFREAVGRRFLWTQPS